MTCMKSTNGYARLLYILNGYENKCAIMYTKLLKIYCVMKFCAKSLPTPFSYFEVDINHIITDVPLSDFVRTNYFIITSVVQ